MKAGWIPRVLALLAGALLPAGFAGAAEKGPEYVWLEGEKPAAVPAGMTEGGVGRPHFVSGRKWLIFTAEAKDVEKKVPAEGLTVSYPFAVKKGGRREVWARIGFEFARAPFQWRLDDGPWKTVSPDDLTCDLMELSFFCEVGWLKLGDVAVPAGKHNVHIRLSRWKNAKGQPHRMLFALDALCIHSGAFVPHGRYKPGEPWRTPRDEKASKNVFELPDAKGPSVRSSVKLNGLWEVCRHDEQLPTEVAAPIRELP